MNGVHVRSRLPGTLVHSLAAVVMIVEAKTFYVHVPVSKAIAMVYACTTYT